jgi:hypothetical protein
VGSRYLENRGAARFAADLDSEGIRIAAGFAQQMDPEGPESRDPLPMTADPSPPTSPKRRTSDIWVAGGRRCATAHHHRYLADDTRPRYTPDGVLRTHAASEYDRISSLEVTTAPVASSCKCLADALLASWTCTPDGKTVVFHATELGKNHLYTLPIMAARRTASSGR